MGFSQSFRRFAAVTLLTFAAALPLITDAEHSLAAAQTAARLEVSTGGFTYSLRRGNLAGRNAYAVAVFPERSVQIDGLATEQQIASFVEANLDILKHSKFSAGGWYDRASGKTYLDIFAVVRSRNMAVTLGERFNQKAILHLRSFQEIPTGGDGTLTHKLRHTTAVKSVFWSRICTGPCAEKLLKSRATPFL